MSSARVLLTLATAPGASVRLGVLDVGGAELSSGVLVHGGSTEVTRTEIVLSDGLAVGTRSSLQFDVVGSATLYSLEFPS